MALDVMISSKLVGTAKLKHATGTPRYQGLGIRLGTLTGLSEPAACTSRIQIPPNTGGFRIFAGRLHVAKIFTSIVLRFCGARLMETPWPLVGTLALSFLPLPCFALVPVRRSGLVGVGRFLRVCIATVVVLVVLPQEACSASAWTGRIGPTAYCEGAE